MLFLAPVSEFSAATVKAFLEAAGLAIVLLEINSNEPLAPPGE